MDHYITITPEMIQAGLRELFQYERGADDGAECVRGLYIAMEEARLEIKEGSAWSNIFKDEEIAKLHKMTKKLIRKMDARESTQKTV